MYSPSPFFHRQAHPSIRCKCFHELSLVFLLWGGGGLGDKHHRLSTAGERGRLDFRRQQLRHQDHHCLSFPRRIVPDVPWHRPRHQGITHTHRRKYYICTFIFTFNTVVPTFMTSSLFVLREGETKKKCCVYLVRVPLYTLYLQYSQALRPSISFSYIISYALFQERYDTVAPFAQSRCSSSRNWRSARNSGRIP